MLQENIRSMNEFPRTGKGMDVIIVSAENKTQEDEWQHHLEGLLGDLIKPTAKVISVTEDWPGGAGNGLGSLYAYQKARTKGLKFFGVDIFDLQKKGASIALYHTAGQGKRLSPLTGSERNNKSAVKLPGFAGRKREFLTILDAIIKQTAIYSESRKGRLSVFWGDQLFIPSQISHYTPQYHVDILVQLESMPKLERWKTENWDAFGVIVVDLKGESHLLEKTSFANLTELIESKKINSTGGVGRSLGSFSLSTSMTFALLEFFQEELSQKKEKMDSDLYFWAPTTLSEELYIFLMKTKGISEEKALKHYQRMQNFKCDFCKTNSSLDYFGTLDIGYKGFWWDYGSLKGYFTNILKLTENSIEGEAMRAFFGVKLDSKTNSVILQSQINSGNYQNCVIIGSNCNSLNVSNCVIVNSILGKFQGDNCLLYNVEEKEQLILPFHAIRADVFLEERHLKLKTDLDRDGKKDWTLRLPDNSISYEEVYRLNQIVSRSNPQ